MLRKTISLPGLHDLDIAPILPLIELPQFQRLRGIRQLGTSSVFIGSNHTRFDHSLYSYSVTVERKQRLLQDRSITPEEAATVPLYALTHDIGHSAFSHAIESLCIQDHNAHGLTIMSGLKKEVEACGGDHDLLLELMSRRNPLHACVSNRPLGTDKLAYLLLDSRNTTEQVGLRIGALLNHVSFRNDGLAIDPSITLQVLALWRAYVDMYVEVYCRKAALISQAFLTKIVDRAIQSGTVDRADLQTFDDAQLYAALGSSPDEIVRRWILDLQTRQLPKAAIEIYLSHVDPLFRENGKPVRRYLVAQDDFNHLPKPASAGEIRMLEGKIADILEIPEQDVLVVLPIPLERLLPDDVIIMDEDETKGTLRSARPMNYQALTETITSATVFRVCVPERFRGHVATHSVAQRVFQALLF